MDHKPKEVTSNSDGNGFSVGLFVVFFLGRGGMAGCNLWVSQKTSQGFFGQNPEK